MRKRCALVCLLFVGAAANGNVGEGVNVTFAPNEPVRNDSGWHFYREIVPEEPEEKPLEPEHPANGAANQSRQSAAQELEAIQQELEEARARAVLYPNPDNLTDYMEKNQWMMHQSATFADVWRRVLWATPELDYSLRRPNNHLALKVFHDDRKQQKARAIKALIDEGWGLFFFFKGSCPYCHRFAPVLAQFQARYGMDVLPVTLDGGVLDDYPNPRFDRDVATTLGVEQVPAVFLVQPTTQQIQPVANGFVGLDELEERLFILTQTQPGGDF